MSFITKISRTAVAPRSYADERMRRALPYGMWRWTDDAGSVVETLFNRHYDPIATRTDGELVASALTPPRFPWPAVAYHYNSDRLPWRSRATREATRRLLREWGIDPAAVEAEAAAAIQEEQRQLRRRWR